MQKITPNLWFDGNAKEAADYDVSIFPDSKIVSITHYPKSSEGGLADFQIDMSGKVLTVDFELDKEQFTAINAVPEFQFNEVISFTVACKDQAEYDRQFEDISRR